MNTLLTLLATASPSTSPGRPEDANVNAGWLGFVFLLALAVAVAFLARSLVKQLARVKYESVPVDPATDGPVEYESDDEAAAAAAPAAGAPAPDASPDAVDDEGARS